MRRAYNLFLWIQACNQPHPGFGSERTRQYVNTLSKNAFQILRMEELMPKVADTDWDDTERAVRTRFPSVLVLEARKLRDV